MTDTADQTEPTSTRRTTTRRSLLYTRVKKSPYFYGSRRHGVAMYMRLQHTITTHATTAIRLRSTGSSSKA